MSNEDIAVLKKRRSTIQGSCTRLKTFVESVPAAAITPAMTAQLQKRLAKLDRYWSDYESVQTSIELLDESESNHRAGFEDAYYLLAGRMRELLTINTTRQAITPSPAGSRASNTSESSSQIRLPKINLPNFSGNYEEWFPFFDTFQSLIRTNDLLDDIQRLQYLRASLSGDAKNIISSLEISAVNYGVAWGLLKERYDNKRVITQSHIKAIMELPSMSRESACELRQIADGAARHVHALQALKRPTSHWDDLLVHILSSKLDSVTMREWQNSLTANELLNFKQFLDFIIHHSQMLESTGKSSVPSSKTLAIPQRIAEIRKAKICMNCLRSTSHIASKCSSGNCKVCKMKHNTLLHLTGDAPQSQAKEEKPQQTTTSPSSPATVVTHSTSRSDECVLLATAIVHAYDRESSRMPCRVLLDCGSQANFISKKFLDTLNLQTRSSNISISGINNTTTRSSLITQVRLQSRINTFATTLDCIVTNRVTDKLPAFTLKRSAFELPRNIVLADPQFNTPADVDILIVTNAQLNEQLSRFWAIETIEGPDNFTADEARCEQHFQDNTTRTAQGRYTVKLPFKEQVIEKLGDTKDIALKRLRGLEKRLARDPNLRAQYNQFLDEYLALGHMKQVEETRVRMTKNPSICHTMLYSRPRQVYPKFGLSSTLRAKAPLSRHRGEDVRAHYRHVRHVIGLYLATRCLKHLAELRHDKYPAGSIRVQRDIYMDDLLTGADSITEAREARDEVIALLREGGFELSKWLSSCPELLDHMLDSSNDVMTINEGRSSSILGIHWNQAQDRFYLSYKPLEAQAVVSKRTILSEISSLFDPLGLLGPIIVLTKLIMQDLWQSDIHWDESIPPDVDTR
ncbi:uncharacterized protein [Temnothorax nylanderi]|uniref:uncharacterized protein n=1 Tax=Temnothorax nylanderi TaxID=102681 RepID=UPI003A8A54FE